MATQQKQNYRPDDAIEYPVHKAHSQDQDASRTSQNATLNESSLSRVDQAAAAEKQSVEGAPTSGEPHEYISGLPFVIITLAIILTGLMVFMDLTILVTAVPEITTVFNSLDDIGWYGNAYTLTMAVLIPLAGKFTKHFVAKWVFIAFLFLFALGSAICGAATSSTMLIIGRAVGGMGGSGLFTTGMNIVANASPMEKRPMMYGIVIGNAQAGIALGPIIGGALTEHASWRWCFYMNLPIAGAIALAMAVIQVPDESVPLAGSLVEKAQKLDLVGFAILGPSTIMLLLALAYGGVDHPWDSSVVIGLLCGAVVGIAVFLFWEQRVGIEAIFPTVLARRRIVWTACVSSMFFFGGLYTSTYYLSIYFQSVKGESPLDAGVNFLPVVVSHVFFVILAGGLMQRVGYYLPFAIVGASFLAIAYGLFSMLDRNSSTAEWAGYQIIMGIGRGLPMQAALIAVQVNVGETLIPIGTAMVLFCQQLGGSIFLAVARIIFTETLRDELKDRIPGVDVEAVVAAGARGDWTLVVAEQDLKHVVEAYTEGVQATFYLGVAVSMAMMIVSFGLGWVDLRKKDATSTETVSEEERVVRE